MEWNNDMVEERRRELASIAEKVCPEDLDKIAEAFDLLDVVGRSVNGEITEGEAIDVLREAHRKQSPRAAIHYRPTQSEYQDMTWDVHPADMQERHLVQCDPVGTEMLSTMTAMSEEVWVLTSGHPDEVTNDKVGLVVSTVLDGRVGIGWAVDMPDMPGSVNAAAHAFTIETMRQYRDTLNAAIRRAEKLRRKMIEQGRVRLMGHLRKTRDLTEDECEAVASAAIEAGTSGMPQVVVVRGDTLIIATTDEGGFEVRTEKEGDADD